jgi:hypothetical protein
MKREKEEKKKFERHVEALITIPLILLEKS